MKILIGLTGKKQSGKSTVADYLVQHFQFTELSFAKPLKEDKHFQ
jgi:dephospho-CoA kinase